MYALSEILFLSGDTFARRVDYNYPSYLFKCKILLLQLKEIIILFICNGFNLHVHFSHRFNSNWFYILKET